jgi:hypothetical protein
MELTQDNFDDTGKTENFLSQSSLSQCRLNSKDLPKINNDAYPQIYPVLMDRSIKEWKQEWKY